MRPRPAALALALLAAACGGAGSGGGGASTDTAPDDEAERLYQEGLTWARKAETAPLPTPPPPPSPLPKDAPLPTAPEFKDEERRALELFEKAVATRPDHAAAQLALADLLAPHAVRHYDRERLEREAAARRRSRRGQPPPTLAPPMSEGVDFSPERVLRAYQAAVQGDPSGRAPVEKMIGFATRVGRLQAAEAGHQELVRRVRESAEPYVLYGDFLVNDKKDLEAAVEQYRQALIWKPDDEATRRKLAEIFLTRGIGYYNRQQFALAEVEFREGAKYITDRSSEQAARLQSYQARLKEIRGR